MSYSPMPNLGILSNDLALATMQMLTDIIVCHFMSYSSNIPNLGSLPRPHGLEEGPLVHRPGPGHLPEIG